MPEAFDAHYKWLGIPPEEQPPNCYRLLGIRMFEPDLDVITSAADKQMAHVRSFQTGKHSALSQKLLNEIAATRICLLNAAKKAEYDAKLRGQLAALESQPQQAQFFDPSQLGLDHAAPKPPPVATLRRQSRGTKLPWQLPAIIGAGLLACVAIFWYLNAAVPELKTAKSGAEDHKTGVKIQTPPTDPDKQTPQKPREDRPNKAEPIPEPKPNAKSDPEPEQPKPEPKPELKPEPKRQHPQRQFVAGAWGAVGSGNERQHPKLQPVADPPEKVAERVKDAFGKAKAPTDFRAVAVDAMKLIGQANTAGKPDIAKTLATLALSAARKADDDDLAKTATACVLEPSKIPLMSDEATIGGTASTVYLDDLDEFDVHVWGNLGKHGSGPDPNSLCLVLGKVPAHSLIPHPPSDDCSSISYRIGAQFSRFRATAIISDQYVISTPMTFRVRGDGTLLWESRPITKRERQQCDVSVRGVRVLTLEIFCAGNAHNGWTVWADPVLVRSTRGRQSDRLPVPDAAAEEQSMKLVRELFKDKYAAAATAERQKALAQELVQKAQTTNDDTNAQYVMLKEAGRFAVQAKGADLAFQVIGEMGTRFDVDAFDLKVKAMMAMCKSHLPQQGDNAIISNELALMEEAVTKEEFDTAKQLGTTAIDLARKSKDSAFIKDTVARKGTITKAMAEIQNAQAEVGEAIATLDKNPTDPAVNLTVGKYHCLLQGKWNKGIPMLALGDDPALKDLAVKELNGVTDAARQKKLGDDWWDLGEKKNGLAKKNIQGHAVFWYQQALPGLTGLLKENVETRLREVPTKPIEPRSSVKIIKAIYGVAEKQLDVTLILQNAIAKDQLSLIQADERAFGDPALRQPKRLLVLCQCGNNRVSLNLSQNEVAIVPPIPPKGLRLSNASQEFTIVAARYGAGLTWVDVTERARSLVANPSTALTVSNSTFDADPWPDIPKHVAIWFDYRGTRYVRVFIEGETHTLLP